MRRHNPLASGRNFALRGISGHRFRALGPCAYSSSMPVPPVDPSGARRAPASRLAAGAACVGLAALLAISPAAASGTDVAVTVRTAKGAPVADVVLVLEAAGAVTPHHREKQTARMEQRERHFKPELLVVETGTLVDFPNNDSVSHQVYSFSTPRRFQLSLYRGSAHPPIAFNTAGLVVLGCNIHDEMVGYILVTDSPYHGQTDAHGTARIAGVPAGAYLIRAWAPRIADPPASLERRIEVGDGAEVAVNFSLSKPLLAAPTPRPGRTEWDAY